MDTYAYPHINIRSTLNKSIFHPQADLADLISRL